MKQKNTMSWFLVLLAVVVLMGCSDDEVNSGSVQITKALGVRTVDSLQESMRRAMGSPPYPGNTDEVQTYLNNFRASLGVDGSIHAISAPLVMTQIGLGSYFCLRGLAADWDKADGQRIFVNGLSENHNLTNNPPNPEALRKYFRALIGNLWGVDATSDQLSKFAALYQEIADGFSNKGANEYRSTMRAVCTAAMGSIHVALTK